jgi:predicted amidohydrolase
MLNRNKWPFLAAAVQFNPKLKQKEHNLRELEKLITEAANNGAKLVVTPEMAMTGYHFRDRDEVKLFAETIPGAATDRFTAICKKYNIYLVFSLPEVDLDTDLYYIAAALIGPDGHIGTYRKTHLWEAESYWAASGDLGFPVFKTPIGSIAVNICMDSIYFESARLPAIAGADILAFPTNSSAQSICLLQARAEANGLYIVSANRSNTEESFHMVGGSAIWSPDGIKLAEARTAIHPEEAIQASEIIYATIDPNQFVNAAKDRLQERRSDLYKELALYISPWDSRLSAKERQIHAKIFQYEPIIGDIGLNVNKVIGMVNNEFAIDARTDLLVFPELTLCGPVDEMSVEQINAMAMETKNLESDPNMLHFIRLAKQYKVYLVIGFIESSGHKKYNSAVLLNDQGAIEGICRKTHLTQSDKRWAEPGEQINVWNTERLGRVGIMIGYDAAFPEVGGILSIHRTELIIIPSSWNGDFGAPLQINRKMVMNPQPESAMVVWDTLAMSAQAYTLVANYTGTSKQYLGSSGCYALDPYYGLDHTICASQDKEEAVYANIRTNQNDWWFTQDKLIASRKPHQYTALIKSKKDSINIAAKVENDI